jgi:ribosomal protein S6--L-glutamate ligase
MRIGILSQNQALYSTRKLMEAAAQRGHDVVVLETTAVSVEISNQPTDTIKLIRNVPMFTPNFERTAVAFLPPVDVIIPRIGASITDYGLAVVRQFEARGVLTTATSEGIASSRNKLHSLQLMAYAGLPVPKTAVVGQKKALATAVAAVGGTPVIVKIIQGTQGQGVILAKNLATAAAVIDKLHRLRQQILVQEYIESNGRDWRIFVVGDRCIAAMERRAQAGEYRANLHRGGTAVPINPDAETQALALKAAKIHNLAVAGVDIIQSPRGPLVLEVNSSPGLEGIEQTTQINVAEAIITYLEEKFHAKVNKQL